ncbi:hypothetical protein JCM15519_37300 [Fundidesulfovibrio butyratiphilus]
MFDSQNKQFLGADASGAQGQPFNTSTTSWLQVLSGQQDSNSRDSAQTTTPPSLADDALTRDWKSTMKSNYTSSLADGDPLDGVAWANLAQMQAKPSAAATGGAGAGKAKVATDAGGVPGQKWDREAAIQHLNKSVQPASKGKCATYVRQAIEAGGGMRLNRGLNSAGGSAYGFGPVLEDAGFKPVPSGTPYQAGDVVVIQQSPRHQDGHTAMFNGEKWISDFEQKDFYGSQEFRDKETPYVIYRKL